MFDDKLFYSWVLMGRGNLANALSGELDLIISIVDDGKHGPIYRSDYSCLGLTILTGQEADPNLDLWLLQVVEWPNQVCKELHRLDSFQEDQHVLIFQHVHYCIINKRVVAVLNRN